MNIPWEAVEAAAKARHDRVQASVQRSAARTIERHESGVGYDEWDGITSDYEDDVREAREDLNRGPTRWEDEDEGYRERLRAAVRPDVEAAAPFIAAQALRDAAQRIAEDIAASGDDSHPFNVGRNYDRGQIHAHADELDPQ